MRGAAARFLLEQTPLRDRRTRKRVVHARRRLFETLGSERYSRPGHDDLDIRLARYLPTVGTFLEAGANDGYTWSNTYYLERRGWSGILIEGIPELSRECRRLRTRSQVFNCALVGHDFPSTHVAMLDSDLTSQIHATDSESPEAGALATEVRVAARTIDDVLAEAGIKQVDFVSLDLEGHEAPALRGFDLDRYRPAWMLIEVALGEGRAAVERALGGRYQAEAEMSGSDVLYRRLSEA